ncbi:hypothetical protein SARC_14078, partial [Sphaeroforma arctica JP610]
NTGEAGCQTCDYLSLQRMVFTPRPIQTQLSKDSRKYSQLNNTLSHNTDTCEAGSQRTEGQAGAPVQRLSESHDKLNKSTSLVSKIAAAGSQVDLLVEARRLQRRMSASSTAKK